MSQLRTGLKEQGVYIFVLLVLTYFTTIGGTIYGVHDFYLGLISHLLAGGTIIGYLLWKLHRGHLLPRTPLDLPILFFLLANLASTLFSTERRLSAENLLFLVIFILVYYLVVDVMLHGWPIVLMVKALLMVGGVVIVLAGLEFLAWYFGFLHLFGDTPTIGWWAIGGLKNPIPPRIERLHITLSNANVLSWFLACLIPLASSQFLATSVRKTRLNLALWVLMASVVLFLTFSRNGFLSAATGIGVFTLALTLKRNQKRLRTLVSRRRNLILFAVTLASIVALAWPAMGWLVSLRPETVQVRWELWRAAIQIARKHWLFGGGPGTFGHLFHQVTDFDPQAPDIFFNTAHNAYLNLAAEAGLLGFLSGLWLMGAAILNGWWAWWGKTHACGQPTSNRNRLTVLGCLAGLIALLVANLFDDTWVYPLTTLLCILLTAIAMMPLSIPGTQTNKASSLALLFAGGALLAIVLWIDAAHYFYARGVRAALRGDWAAASEEMEEARSIDPAFTLYHYQWGVVRGNLALERDDRTALQEAIYEYRQEVERGGNQAINQSNLAWLEWRGEERDEALDHMRRAVSLAPCDPRYHLGLGLLWEEQGEEEKALAEYAQAIAYQPSLLSTGFWQSSPLRRERTAELHDRAKALLQGEPTLSEGNRTLSLAELAYYGGELEEAQGYLDSLFPSATTYFLQSRISAARGARNSALDLLEKALKLDPTLGSTYLERGKLYLSEGRDEQALRDFQMALFLHENTAHYYLGELAYRSGDMVEAITEFQRGLFSRCSMGYHYASFVYHRENLPVDFSPTLLRCPPQDDLISIYLHLADGYGRTGEEEKGQEICDWLSHFYETSLLNERDGYSEACP